jgi:hypothetical protein
VQLGRAVTAKAQIRLVLETFRDKLPTEIFPGRTTVPKTLTLCKDDAHAEEVVTTIREVFGKGNDFAAKITYTARDPKGHLQAFRTSASLRVAVTVDMIATGTDVKPLECVFFMRHVRSASYFEQMKGRGARTINGADFQDRRGGLGSRHADSGGGATGGGTRCGCALALEQDQVVLSRHDLMGPVDDNLPRDGQDAGCCAGPTRCLFLADDVATAVAEPAGLDVHGLDLRVAEEVPQ